MVNAVRAGLRSRWGRRAAVVLVLLLAGAFYFFAPWKLFVNTAVDDRLPASAGAPAHPAAGRFVSYEHATSGTAEVVTLSDGSRLLRLTDLRTSDGPDVRVYLSEKAADAGLHGFGEGYVELGKLKGNLGNQNYQVPAGVDLARYRSVVLWCKRFSVAFGAAPLAG